MQRLSKFCAALLSVSAILIAGALVPGCNGGGSGSNPFIPGGGGGGAQLRLSQASGQVLAPGAGGVEVPVANALVRLVRVDNDGDVVAEIARDTADANGNFQMNFASLLVRANLWLIATGGNATRAL